MCHEVVSLVWLVRMALFLVFNPFGCPPTPPSLIVSLLMCTDRYSTKSFRGSIFRSPRFCLYRSLLSVLFLWVLPVFPPQTLSSKFSTQDVCQVPPGFLIPALWPGNSLEQSAVFRLEGYPSRPEAEVSSSWFFFLLWIHFSGCLFIQRSHNTDKSTWAFSGTILPSQ